MPIGLPSSTETVKKHSTSIMLYGVALALIGVIAIVAPVAATVVTSLFVGWLLLISGGVGLFAVWRAGTHASGFWWNLLTAALYVVAGLAVLLAPVTGALTLTIILAAYMLATGVTKIFVAVGYRQGIPGAWVWMLLSAVIDILLGAMIMMGLPGTGMFVLGLLVGINLFFTGVALIVAAVYVRRTTA